MWSPPVTDAITISDAFEKQLGLKLALTKVATPVLVIEKANVPRVTDSPKPRMEFEVAEIRAEDPNGPPIPCGSVGMDPSVQAVHITGRITAATETFRCPGVTISVGLFTLQN